MLNKNVSNLITISIL